MFSHTPDATDEQAELMTALLEGEDPDCWVVLPANALVTQMMIALRETRNSKGEHRPGLASARLLHTLSVLGFTRNTLHGQQVDR